ncbi:hypothetical protein CASP1_00001 [Alcaligenes phage CASP1]|nr:hypothetical protein CASP1_00001 [Alcaligenes phage CASP1]
MYVDRDDPNYIISEPAVNCIDKRWLWMERNGATQVLKVFFALRDTFNVYWDDGFYAVVIIFLGTEFESSPGAILIRKQEKHPEIGIRYKPFTLSRFNSFPIGIKINIESEYEN